MEHISDLPSEDNRHHRSVPITENSQKDLPALEVAMDGEPSLQSRVSTDACDLGDPTGSVLGGFCNESNADDKNGDQCEEPLASINAVHTHEISGKKEIDNFSKEQEWSDCAPSNQATLQEHCIEGNLLPCKLVKGDGLNNSGTASCCHHEETLTEQTTLSSGICVTEVVDVENQITHFTSRDDSIACGEADLVEDIGDSFRTDSVVKSCIYGIEAGKLGLNEIIKATSGDSIAEVVSDETLSGDQNSLFTTIASNTSPSDENAEHMAASETACLVLQESFFEQVEEIEKEGNTGYTDFASDGNAALEMSNHSSRDAKASVKIYALKNVEECSVPVVRSEIKSIADAEERAKSFTRDNSNVGDRNTLDRKFSQDPLFRENIASTVEVSKGSIEDDANYDDEDCLSAAANTCLSASSPKQDTLNAQCSVEHTTVAVNVVGDSPSHTEHRAGSSEFQHQGCMGDNDGGSSTDSTAGTGLERTVGCALVEDEEANSAGGDDTAGSPAFVQPLRQQRKTINIHHQFVREIVKIQHNREQYDREQGERQLQAATLAQEQRSNFSEKKDIGGEANIQNGLNDVGVHKQVNDSQQKHSTKNKKSLTRQSRNESLHQRDSLQESNEQSRHVFSHTLGAKEHGLIGRGKQQRSMSIYQPPVVRESLAAEHRNLEELETRNRQSRAYAMNNLLDGTASSFTEPCVPIAGSPQLGGSSKVVRSSSGEGFADSLERQSEHSSTPGMGIKVTFDTEKRQRHIRFSDGLDSFSRGEQASPAASHSSPAYRVNKDSNPLSHTFHDAKFSSGSRQHVDHGEMHSKGNDRHVTQAARSVGLALGRPLQESSSSSGNWQIDNTERFSQGNDHHFIQAARSVNPPHGLPFQDSKFSSGSRQVVHGETPLEGNDYHFMQAVQGFPPAEPSQTRGRAGKSSEKPTEKKNSFFERADSSANLNNLRSWLEKSPPFIQHGSDSQSISNNSTRHSDLYAGMPSPSLQSFSIPISQRTTPLGPSSEGGFFDSPSFAGINVRSEESKRTSLNIMDNVQFTTPRCHDSRANPRYAHSGRGEKKSHHKNSTKEFNSPFEAMMRDVSRPQALFSGPAQRPTDANQNARGFGTSWHAKDNPQTHSQEALRETFRRSQSDASRKASMQNLQAQLTSPPPRETLFCTMPMQEKWGDIADDLTDSFDYLQIRRDGEREMQSGSLPYRASNPNNVGFLDSKPVFRDSKQDGGMPKSSYKEINCSQKHTELVREHLVCETSARKSVFERLGPQNNFQESILGPPPKMLDSRGVLKASPDHLISNVPAVSNFNSFVTGFYSSPWGSQLPCVQNENADDEGREVVVQAYTEVKQRRSKRELYVPRRGS